ncbi:MAG: hypothetical protein ACJ76B_07890 [Solirubrobacterales bacterium]
MKAGRESAASRHGQVLENPVTGERVVMLTDPVTHPEGALVAHLYVEPRDAAKPTAGGFLVRCSSR